MRKISVLLVFVVLLSVLFVGCGKNSGSEYLGKWVNSQTNSETLEIKKNGDTFIVAQTIPDFLGKKPGDMKTNEFPAAYKDGMLTINAGLGQTTISYVKDDDALILNGHRFKRQK